MQQTNLFYQPQILQLVAEYLPLKDILNTATLSKEHHQLLKQYLQSHYQLINKYHQNQFQQLRQLLNRGLFVYQKGEVKKNPSNFITRSIDSYETYSVIQTVDLQYKLVKTGKLLQGEMAELIPLPQRYKFVKISETGMMYCSQGQKLTRYNLNADPLSNGQHLHLKGQVQDFICGNRYSLGIVREQPDSVSLLLFDDKDPLSSFRVVQTPFSIPKFESQNHLTMGKGTNYLVFNETLYELNVKTASIHIHPQFNGRSIVKCLGGSHHFVVYERTQQRSEDWSTEQIIKFAQKEGLQDYIKIFKTEKVTGKTLMAMDKKYMEDVLGIENAKHQIKLRLRLEQSNVENPDEYVAHIWGRAAQGQLGTNPAKDNNRPIKLKLPADCQVFKLSGNFTFIHNKKDKKLLVNSIDEKTNKLQWKQITNRKVWDLTVVDNSVILVASAGKDKTTKRMSEEPVVQKKEKLRTAKNIIDKIVWSEHLEATEFKVGYLDKYDGILEVPFKELEQSQIKQYRIEYFKQGTQVVWDKKKRIDIL